MHWRVELRRHGANRPESRQRHHDHRQVGRNPVLCKKFDQQADTPKIPCLAVDRQMDRYELTRMQYFTNRANYVVAVEALKVWGSWRISR